MKLIKPTLLVSLPLNRRHIFSYEFHTIHSLSPYKFISRHSESTTPPSPTIPRNKITNLWPSPIFLLLCCSVRCFAPKIETVRITLVHLIVPIHMLIYFNACSHFHSISPNFEFHSHYFIKSTSYKTIHYLDAAAFMWIILLSHSAAPYLIRIVRGLIWTVRVSAAACWCYSCCVYHCVQSTCNTWMCILRFTVSYFVLKTIKLVVCLIIVVVVVVMLCWMKKWCI